VALRILQINTVPIREHQKEELKDNFFPQSLPKLHTHTVTISILQNLPEYGTSHNCIAAFPLLSPPYPSTGTLNLPSQNSVYGGEFPHSSSRLSQRGNLSPEGHSRFQDLAVFRGDLLSSKSEFSLFSMARVCVSHSHNFWCSFIIFLLLIKLFFTKILPAIG
jgi:hypothetical protein